jgi:hypothetical protein
VRRSTTPSVVIASNPLVSIQPILSTRLSRGAVIRSSRSHRRRWSGTEGPGRPPAARARHEPTVAGVARIAPIASTLVIDPVDAELADAVAAASAPVIAPSVMSTRRPPHARRIGPPAVR